MSEFLYTAHATAIPKPSNKDFRLHSHSEYEIYMFLEGDSKYVVEEKNYALSPGDIIIIRKHEMHRVFHNSEGFYRNVVIMVAPEFFKARGCAEYENAFLDMSSAKGNKISADTVRSSGLYDAIMRLRRYSDGFTLPHTAVTDSVMVEILYIINRISVFEAGDITNKTVKNVVNYINNRFTEEITLDVLCERFFVSKYHLCRVFREATGLTVQGYIRQKRLILADELKKEGKTLTEAALASGFKDYSSFYRAYTKSSGVSPRSGSRSGGQ